MKVLMISKAVVWGAYHGKLRELARHGVDLTVISPARWGRQPAEISDATEYKIKFLPCTLSGFNHFHFYRSLLQATDADLVHIDEDPWSLVTYQWMRYCVKRGVPALFFTWQNIHKSFPPPFRQFENYSFHHAAGAIAGNEEARDVLFSKKFTRPSVVIPQFGVDPVVYQRHQVDDLKQQLGLHHKFVVGYVGRLVREKGIADLICAFAHMPERCVLVMVGDGNFRGPAETLAGNLNIASRIRWISNVPSLQIPRYMSLLNVLVLPSRTTRSWKEQFGRVLIEAMASETVVVGSGSGEIPSVIGEAGLVYPEGDVAELSSRLRTLEAAPQLMEKFRAAGLRRVLQNFTHREVAVKTVQFYDYALRQYQLGFPQELRSPADSSISSPAWMPRTPLDASPDSIPEPISNES